MRSLLVRLVLLSGVVGMAFPGSGGGAATPPPHPGLGAAIAAQERHTRELMAQPGIVGTAVGLDRSRHAVVRVYTQTAGTTVPTSLDGVPVQRVVTGPIVAREATLRYPRPVPIGVSTGHPTITAGTIGARVTDGTNVYALSNNHVYAASNAASLGDPELQPGAIDGGTDPADTIGTLADFQPIEFDGSDNTIDAAIALSSTASLGTGTLAGGYGTPTATPVAASVNQQVQKYGRTTELTSGQVKELNVTIDVCYELVFTVCTKTAHFVDQIGIGPGTFSAGGDSGSLIVAKGSNDPVALLFAGGSNRTFANPIGLVLSRFDVGIDPGGPVQPTAPGAPAGLSVLGVDGGAQLAWSAPAGDGGSPVTGYRIYRGTAPGAEQLLATVGPTGSYADSPLGNGSAYYYQVSAVNAIGEGPRSAEASATPLAQTPLDSFDRPDESPLSDAGRWTNGIKTSELGLKVSSDRLACAITSTATAWRNDQQYGPDAQASVTISTLPGAGNAVRLYLRLQTPGTSGIDGYMLLYQQGASGDTVSLTRLDNGTITILKSFPTQAAAGDRLLLRTLGTRLEAWQQTTTGWQLLGTTTDGTYKTAGYTGLGLRGTTGRLDDFTARTS